MSLIELRGVSRSFAGGAAEVHALRGVDLSIGRGEFVAIVGPSGGGKTTLLSILGGLDAPTSGAYLFDGEPVPTREGPELAALRSRVFGFVFQGFHLLEQRPALDSVALGMLYQGVAASERTTRAGDAARRVGLGDRLAQRTATLSGGQRQRLAIARAIATRSPVLLADEPTGNLDSATGEQVMAELRRLNAAGVTVVVVTHSLELAATADRVVRIVDGRVVDSAPAGAGASATARESGPGRAERGEGEGAATARGRARVRVTDVIRDAAASLLSRSRQTLALAATVGVAIALLVSTLGITFATSAQVSSTFDAHANREVAATWEAAGDPSAADELRAAGGLAGVDAAAVLTDYPDQPVGNLRDQPRAVTVHEATGALADAADAVIRGAGDRDPAGSDRAAGSDITGSLRPGALGHGEAIVGRALAGQLQLGPLAAGPVITVAGESYLVRGILESSGRAPMLLGEVVVGAVPGGLEPGRRTLLVLAQPGAAQQIAAQLPPALDPFAPDRFSVQAPTDPRGLRAEIEAGVQTALVAFTVVSALVAVLTLMNGVGSAVTARRAELGLRRALGARSGQLASLVVVESTIVGAVGGILGLFAGMIGILAFTIVQRWVPVFDVRLAPLAILGGVLVGAAASAVGAVRAARVSPVDALRQ
ncbi:ABC transporter ATP-binding protein/permease [Microbacterium sp. NEAU-LLC]|uniref:ABC transporter ATP-binding protein/permease n=1 Tax=Microbacterium helvum TaxID=2773713 RepID=A0ABR8NSX7_9MICO|nr:ABC transporter ATP-binding protein/permease [Microbacterium helvum]MBD3943123.1 ABC transporter ATP-binding protein/permease [Microbacterium helvum]